jgi:hypothetical protein
MKTMKFRLLAMVITLAAVITATTQANAQRRSTTNDTNNEKVENTRSASKSNIEKKSTFREVAREPKAANRSVKGTGEVKRYNAPVLNENTRESARVDSRSDENISSKSTRNESGSKLNGKQLGEKERGTSNRSNSNPGNWKSDAEKSVANAAEMNRRTTGMTNSNGKSREKESYNSNRTSSDNYAERYNHKTIDDRYNTSREYRGSNKYWSPEYRSDVKGKKHYYENYNYNNYKHWERSWENYRWNHNSWRNYYGYYNPYSYRNHKYYHHHPYYGHVIRKFVHKPQIYIHNHNRYYCYDGYFFRYRSGVGYVLVDVPFGMVFEYLPNDYERVYINGYLYFRIGNLFFERTNYGFLLVHYPERYYAYNDGYRCEGFRFNDLNF